MPTLGESNGKLPLSTAQDAAYQNHTSRLTELWSLPKPAQGLNTYNNNRESDAGDKVSHELMLL